MRSRNPRTIDLAIGFLLIALALATSASAGTLHQASNGSTGTVLGPEPGAVLWTYYLTTQTGVLCPGTAVTNDVLCNTEGAGDNIIRLINPNGAANGNLVGVKEQPVCAMIYVFDDDEEMGECCGCPLSSTRLATFSVEKNLSSNWALRNQAHGNGSIAIVAASPNTPVSCLDQSPACNSGCDPTNVPGYFLNSQANLLGSITHQQEVAPRGEGISEIPLSDDGGGDQINLIYLEAQCGALIGNGSGAGLCNCPTE